MWETKVEYSVPPKIEIKFKRLHPKAILPTFKTEGSSGADLYAAVDLIIQPGKTGLVPLGFAVSMPRGLEIQIRPRSGLALTHAVTVLNTPATVDSDYRGEFKVILANFGPNPFYVTVGDRIAQAVVAYVPRVVYTEMEDAEELDDTSRGAGGFGSTGRRE